MSAWKDSLIEEEAVKPIKLLQSNEAKQYRCLFFKNLLKTVPYLVSSTLSAMLIDLACSAQFLE